MKFAAKIASDLCKPDGLLEVPRGQVPAFLAPLPASRLWGVPRTDEQLQPRAAQDRRGGARGSGLP